MMGRARQIDPETIPTVTVKCHITRLRAILRATPCTSSALVGKAKHGLQFSKSDNKQTCPDQLDSAPKYAVFLKTIMNLPLQFLWALTVSTHRSQRPDDLWC